jgi:NTP pyrophosphatase (non-canonical NTP hydrolase)
MSQKCKPTGEEMNLFPSDSYERFVESRVKTGKDVLAEMTPEKAYAALNALAGAEFMGDEVDAAKRWCIYGKGDNPLDDMDAEAGIEMLAGLTPRKAHMVHMGLGIAGEAGEIAKAVGEWCDSDGELDVDNIIEEVGDCFFYLQGILLAIGVTRNEVMAANVAKLSKRYPSNYSNEAALSRADKAEGEADGKEAKDTQLGQVDGSSVFRFHSKCVAEGEHAVAPDTRSACEEQACIHGCVQEDEVGVSVQPLQEVEAEEACGSASRTTMWRAALLRRLAEIRAYFTVRN